MTPEQQIREAFEELYLRATEKQAWLEELRDTHEAALDRLVADLDATEELRRRAIAEADRLVAERDEARRDYDEATDELATELAQARIEANEAEGREAALREAAIEVCEALERMGDRGAEESAPKLRAALAGVPAGKEDDATEG